MSQNPAAFGRLSPADRDLVQRGQIRDGMSMEAVHLAWGKPDKRLQDGPKERWLWFHRVPVQTGTIVGIGPGHPGGFTWGGGYDFGPGGGLYGGSNTEYVKQTWRAVDFSHGRVAAWKSSR